MPTRKSRTYCVIHVLIWFNPLFYLANLPAEIWTCVPRNKIWEPAIDGKCLDNDAILVGGGVVNLVSDFGILFIPLVLITRLQMPRAKKIGVSAVFATGFLHVFGSFNFDFSMLISTALVFQASCILSQPSKQREIPIRPIAFFLSNYGRMISLNRSILISGLNLHSTAELALGVTCSSLLTMPHFFRHVMSKIKGTKRAKSTFVSEASRSKPPPHWHNVFDTTTSGSRQDNYLELQDSPDSHDWRSPKTTIHGQLQYPPPTKMTGTVSSREPVVTSKEAAMEAGILKTVRMKQSEQYPAMSA